MRSHGRARHRHGRAGAQRAPGPHEQPLQPTGKHHNHNGAGGSGHGQGAARPRFTHLASASCPARTPRPSSGPSADTGLARPGRPCSRTASQPCPRDTQLAARGTCQLTGPVHGATLPHEPAPTCRGQICAGRHGTARCATGCRAHSTRAGRATCVPRDRAVSHGCPMGHAHPAHCDKPSPPEEKTPQKGRASSPRDVLSRAGGMDSPGWSGQTAQGGLGVPRGVPAQGARTGTLREQQDGHQPSWPRTLAHLMMRCSAGSYSAMKSCASSPMLQTKLRTQR